MTDAKKTIESFCVTPVGIIIETPMSKTVTLRLADETYDEFREAAEAQHRPLSNLIETAALARIREEQFTDDVEMAELLADEKLLKRLKKGSADARRRKGRFVE